MSLQKSDVEKIAHLARLSINEDDIPSYADNLSNILTLVDQLNAVNTDGIAPMAHPQDAAQRLREDKVTETDQRDLLMKNAPKTAINSRANPKVQRYTSETTIPWNLRGSWGKIWGNTLIWVPQKRVTMLLSTVASPMVTMITVIMGSPISGLSIKITLVG